MSEMKCKESGTHTAYGLYFVFDVDDLICWREGVLQADLGAEVYMEIGGQVRTMTFQEFFIKMGFDDISELWSGKR